MRVLVTFAVEAEFAPWRRRHAFRRKESVHGSHRGGSDVWYSSRIDDLTLDVYLTGVGWKGARTFLSSLLKEKPDLCISSGLAGGLKPELKSGEIVVAREALLVNGGKKLRSRPLLVESGRRNGRNSRQFVPHEHPSGLPGAVEAIHGQVWRCGGNGKLSCFDEGKGTASAGPCHSSDQRHRRGGSSFGFRVVDGPRWANQLRKIVAASRTPSPQNSRHDRFWEAKRESRPEPRGFS